MSILAGLFLSSSIMMQVHARDLDNTYLHVSVNENGAFAFREIHGRVINDTSFAGITLPPKGFWIDRPGEPVQAGSVSRRIERYDQPFSK